MQQEFLMRFLEIGAINLNSDDTKLEKLRTTAKDLATTLRKAPSKTISFTMVAADPSVPPTDPVVDEAMSALRKRWETVANAFTGRPVNILRAILLDAIVQAAREDDAIAVAFVNTARNALGHAETADEAPIWLDAVHEIEIKVDARAEAEWATPEMITIEPLKYTAPLSNVVKSEAPKIDRSDLRKKILSAAGSWGDAPTNQYQPAHQPQQWSQDFAKLMTSAIAEAVEAVTAEFAPSPVDLSEPLSSLAKAVATHVGAALTSFSGATAGLQRRTNLLWWKEALYSTSIHKSYVEMPVFQASALMALDLHEQVPTFSPASVSAFLKEAIRCLPGEPDSEDSGRRDIEMLVSDARNAEFMEPFRVLAAQYATLPAGRGPLLSLIGHTQDPPTIESTALRALAGVDASTTMTPSEWGTFLFRELQAARATNVSATKRPKKR